VEAQPLFQDDANQSNNLLTISFTVCDTTNSGDDPDSDGLTNIQEVFVGTNPCEADTDQDGIGDGSDNCGTVPNASQTNSDTGPPPPPNNTGGLGNGPSIVGDDTTVPNGDALGDACDPDADNDGIPDHDELLLSACGAFSGAPANHPFPIGGDNAYADGDGPSWDTDGDSVRDGIECDLGFNPRDAGSKPSVEQCGGNTDTDLDGLTDAWERCKWGTNPTVTDSDGDGLGDCTEVMDVNGNGSFNASDATQVLQHFFGIVVNGSPFVGDLASMDVNGNGQINAADATLILRAFFDLNPCI
jgi:hypothetical protein